MPREPEGLRRVTVHIDSQLADWADEYARLRGLGRDHIYETALMVLRDRGIET